MQSEIINYPVYFNSADRLNQNDPTYKATFKIQDLVNLNSRKKAYLSMPYVAIPPTFYIITTQNNTITVNETTWPAISVLTYTVTIQPGNYSISDFITILTATMTEQSALFGYALTYGGSYNSATGRMSIFISLPANDPNHSFSYTFQGSNVDLKNFMGFNNTFDNITVPFPALLTPPQFNYSYTSPNPVNFAASLPSIYVRINIFRTDTCYDTSDPGALEGSAGDIIQVVPITSNGFSQTSLLAGYEGIEQKRIQVSNILNSNITFTLTGADNNFPVNLNGYDWQGVLMIQYTSENKK